MKKEKILVIGATGMVGSALVKQLLEQGVEVRGTTSREPAAHVTGGVEWVRVDLSTGAGVRAAFEGVARAFLLSPPGFADQHRILSPLIQEAKRRGLRKVVLMTAMGADAVEISPLRRAEKELERSGLKYNIIRPNWFLQNFHTFWGQGVRGQGKILLPAGRAKVSFVDARDISAVAARLLTDDGLSARAFDLTGPEAIDHDEAALAIGEATGREVTYEEIPPEALKKGLLSAGLPSDYADFLLMIFGALRDGHAARVTPSVSELLGREPGDVNGYARDHRAALV